MKRPLEAIRETMFENLDKLQENQKTNFENSEKFLLWVVGFSIAGITIIASNISEFRMKYDGSIVKSTLVLLTASIVSGIVYRWAFFHYQLQYQKIEFFLHGAFSNQEVVEVDSQDISEETDIMVVLRRIKLDYNEDYSAFLELYLRQNEVEKLETLTGLKKYYKILNDDAIIEYEFAKNHVKEIYKDAFGISDKTAGKIFRPHNPRKFKLYGWVTAIALLVSVFTFTAVLIVLCLVF
jgi:hypothetical protein